MRFDDDLMIAYDIQTTEFLIPALTVQPLAENAVKYGVGKKVSGGTVTISAKEAADCFEIIVADDGVGYDLTATQYDGRRTHIGIDNVRARLAAMSGGTLDMQSTKDVGTIATIRLPRDNRSFTLPATGLRQGAFYCARASTFHLCTFWGKSEC